MLLDIITFKNDNDNHDDDDNNNKNNNNDDNHEDDDNNNDNKNYINNNNSVLVYLHLNPTSCLWHKSLCYHRADSRFVPSQWQTSLQSNGVSHWLGANPRISPAIVWLIWWLDIIGLCNGMMWSYANQWELIYWCVIGNLPGPRFNIKQYKDAVLPV